MMLQDLGRALHQCESNRAKQPRRDEIATDWAKTTVNKRGGNVPQQEGSIA